MAEWWRIDTSVKPSLALKYGKAAQTWKGLKTDNELPT